MYLFQIQNKLFYIINLAGCVYITIKVIEKQTGIKKIKLIMYIKLSQNLGGA